MSAPDALLPAGPAPLSGWHGALQPLLALFALDAWLQTALFASMTLPALRDHGGAEGSGAWTVAWAALVFSAAALLWTAVLGPLARWRRARGPVRALASTVGALALVLVAVDCMVFDVLGVRMDDYFVLAALDQGHFLREAQLGPATFASMGLAILLAWIGHWLALGWLWRRGDRGVRWPLKVAGAALALSALAGGAVTAATLPQAQADSDPSLAALPLGSVLLASHDQGGHITVRHPALTAPGPHRVGKPHNLVMVLVESLRGDFATPELMPRMNALSAAPGCLKGDNHHSGGHATSWGVFSFLYGLNSYHFLPFHKQAVPSLPLQVLKGAGYELVGVSGSSLRGWDHSDFMLDNFETYREFTDQKGWRNDKKMLAWIERWAQSRDQSRPFALFVFVLSPHHNYYYPPEFERFTPVMPENYNHFMQVDKLRAFRDKIVNRYRNSVVWVDHLLSQILDAVGGPQQLAFAISGDHGEEFWDHGLLGHGAPRLYNARTQVPLFVCVPGSTPPKPAISTHADIWPTLLDGLALDPPLPPEQWSDGVSLLRAASPDRFVVVTGVGFPFDGRVLGLLHAGYKLWLERDGPLHRFKITRRLTPDDRELGAQDTPDERKWLHRLGVQMRRFLRTENAVTRTRPEVQHPLDVRIGPWLRLVGYDLELRDPRPGGTAVVRWVFECLQPVPEPWQLFVHLSPGQSRTFRNLDHVPVDGTLPLSRWQVGDFVRDEHVIELPSGARPGEKLALTLGAWAPGQGRAEIRGQGRVEKGALVVTEILVTSGR